MSDENKFVDLAVRGEVLASEIDDYVSAWHADSGCRSTLGAFLGMSPDEYRLWFEDPSSIDDIIAARHNRIAIHDYVLERLQTDYRLAAREGRRGEMKRLEIWLRDNGFKRSHPT